jgi:8-oxo-dGTP diphosphatase
MKVNFYKFNEIEDDKLKFAVIMARYMNQWIFVKHKERDTWEIPGGHREEKESIKETANRELREETGAIKFKLNAISVYSVVKEKNDTYDYDESYGALFFADIEELGQLPNLEIGEICLFSKQPTNLTYPLIQPHLFNKVSRIYTLDNELKLNRPISIR